MSERIRAAARRAAAVAGDARAEEAIAAGVVEVEREVATWEGSLGAIHGTRVRLELPAALVARVRANPATQDALHAAFAAAVAAEGESEALLELCVRWGALRVVDEGPYRGAAAPMKGDRSPGVVKAALEEYLRAADDGASADAVARGHVEEKGDFGSVVRLAAEDHGAAGAIEEALAALLGPGKGRVAPRG